MERVEQYVLLNIRFYFLIIYSFYRNTRKCWLIINDKLFIFLRISLSGIYVKKNKRKKKKSTPGHVMIIFFIENDLAGTVFVGLC